MQKTMCSYGIRESVHRHNPPSHNMHATPAEERASSYWSTRGYVWVSTAQYHLLLWNTYNVAELIPKRTFRGALHPIPHSHPLFYKQQERCRDVT